MLLQQSRLFLIVFLEQRVASIQWNVVPVAIVLLLVFSISATVPTLFSLFLVPAHAFILSNVTLFVPAPVRDPTVCSAPIVVEEASVLWLATRLPHTCELAVVQLYIKVYHHHIRLSDWPLKIIMILRKDQIGTWLYGNNYEARPNLALSWGCSLGATHPRDYDRVQ